MLFLRILLTKITINCGGRQVSHAFPRPQASTRGQFLHLSILRGKQLVGYSPLRLWVPRDIFRHTGSSTRGAEGQEEPDYGRQIRPLKFRVKLLWRSVDIHNRSVYPWIALTLSIPAPPVQTFSGSKGSKITKTLSRHCM